jgi:hypothetical protein
LELVDPTAELFPTPNPEPDEELLEDPIELFMPVVEFTSERPLRLDPDTELDVLDDNPVELP